MTDTTPDEPEQRDMSAGGHVPSSDMQERDDPGKNTHLWIVMQSLDMLRRLTGPDGVAAKMLLELTGEYISHLHQGIWDADNESPWDDFRCAYHFYNPETGTNFYPCIPVNGFLCQQTAREWGAKCFGSSLDNYQDGDYATAVYYLGLSLHYLTALSQPMHAAPFTALDPRAPSYHSGFESYALKWTNKNMPRPITYEQTIFSDAFEDYIDVAAGNSLERSATLLSAGALLAWNTLPEEVWANEYGDGVIRASLDDIRRITSQYLLMWIKRAVRGLTDQAAPLWFTDGYGQEVPGDLRLRRT